MKPATGFDMTASNFNATNRRANHHHSTHSTHSTYNQTSSSSSSHLHPSSEWDGTLSATLFRYLAYFLQAISSKNIQSDPLSKFLIHFQRFKSSSSNPSSLSSSQIWFGFLCALWYSSSALSSNTGKIILNQFTFPVTLTIVQFGIVAIWSGFILILRHHLRSFRLHGNLGYLNFQSGGIRHWINALGITLPNRCTIRSTCIMSLFSIAGHVFSSMAISRVPVSTVHTIKALSPLFTVIAYSGLFGVRYGLSTYFSLLPLTLGVMLACSFDMRANWIGFLCALGSTVIFVSQNIFGKKLLPNNYNKSNNQSHLGLNRRRSLSSSGTGIVQMDKLNLLFYSSAIAFLMMIPIWMYADLSALLWFGDTNYNISSSRSVMMKENQFGNSIGLFGYFMFNGTVHFTQCILAFSILSRTSPVTYSIASLIKRVAVICLAIIWFGQKVSLTQGLGMVLTFLGLYVYNQSKSEIEQGEKRRGILERKNDLLSSLPSTLTDLKNLEESDPILHHHSKTHHQHQHQPIHFENPFRRESSLATLVKLNDQHENPNHENLIAEQVNSSGRVMDRTSMSTRESVPGISTSFTSPSSCIQPNYNSNQSPTFNPNHTRSQLSNHAFNHSNSNANLKSSPLQESNPFRSIVNVR